MYPDLLGQGNSKQRQSCLPMMKVIGKALRSSKSTDWRVFRKPRDKDAEWSIIAALISKTTQLRSVTFACREAMPPMLLKSIHNYPTLVRLNWASWTRRSDMSCNDPTELELLGSPSLMSLQAYISNPERNTQDLRLPAFWRLVRSSPNLQSLMLDIRRGGCVVKWDSPQQIQEWKLLASDFERTTVSRGNLPSAIRNLKINGADLSRFKDNELSQLKHLDCSKYLPLQILPLLSSLAHLTLRGHYLNNEAIDLLLLDCIPLASLNVIGWRNCLKLGTIFTRHGSSLRALALHELENVDAANPRQVLSIEELHDVQEGCPHLKELSIDLNFPESPLLETDHLSTGIHQEIYDTLSTFPSLRRLQLNVNLGISTYNKQRFDRPRKSLPLANEAFVKDVWTTINHGRPRSMRIQELRVSQGESQRSTGQGRPAGWVTWEQSARHWLKATQSERDDEPDEISISSYKDIPDFSEDLWRECRW